MKEQTPFTKSVLKVLKKIPRGSVATYAQIALLAGNPRAVRGVVWILHSSSHTHGLPWHRVINSKGRISFPVLSESFLKQKGMLEREGVEVGAYGEIELNSHQWKKKGTPERGPRNKSKA